MLIRYRKDFLYEQVRPLAMRVPTAERNGGCLFPVTRKEVGA
jgi:hypothetical protein